MQFLASPRGALLAVVPQFLLATRVATRLRKSTRITFQKTKMMTETFQRRMGAWEKRTQRILERLHRKTKEPRQIIESQFRRQRQSAASLRKAQELQKEDRNKRGRCKIDLNE